MLNVTNFSGFTEYQGSSGYVTRAWKYGKVLNWTFGIYYNTNVSSEQAIRAQLISRTNTYYDSFTVSHAARFSSSISGVLCYYGNNVSSAEYTGLVLTIRFKNFDKSVLIHDTITLISSANGR